MLLCLLHVSLFAVFAPLIARLITLGRFIVKTPVLTEVPPITSKSEMWHYTPRLENTCEASQTLSAPLTTADCCIWSSKQSHARVESRSLSKSRKLLAYTLDRPPNPPYPSHSELPTRPSLRRGKYPTNSLQCSSFMTRISCTHLETSYLFLLPLFCNLSMHILSLAVFVCILLLLTMRVHRQLHTLHL